MKNNLSYYLMSYVMFLYPPFIYGMILINFNSLNDLEIWLYGIGINILLVILTSFALYILAKKKKIPVISKDEKAHFLFGYIGNIIVFLYVYQYLMKIEKFVSVFSLVLLIVISYKYLISKKIIFLEIFHMSIIFALIDYIIIASSGNTLFNSETTLTNTESYIFQILFISAILYALILYVIKLYKINQFTKIRYVLVFFIGLSLLMLYINEEMEELIATLFIISLFTWFIDMILRLIHKEFKALDLVFYARIIMISIVIFMIKEMKLYQLPTFDLNQMFLLISIFYVSSFSDIVMHISPKQNYMDIDFTIVTYLKQLYKPLITKYKDIVLISSLDLEIQDFNKLGRSMIRMSELGDIVHLDDDSISMAFIFVKDIKDLDTIFDLNIALTKCIISNTPLNDQRLKTSFTDFNYYIYTI